MDNIMTSSGSNEVKKIINGLECDSKKILLGGKVILVPFLGQKVTHLSRILCLPARKSISPLITFFRSQSSNKPGHFNRSSLFYKMFFSLHNTYVPIWKRIRWIFTPNIKSVTLMNYCFRNLIFHSFRAAIAFL